MVGRMVIGVEGRFTASHVCGEVDRHEHTWIVKAKFRVAERADARCTRAALHHLLASWEGKPTPADMEWGFEIARVVGLLANCVWVEVSHDDISDYWPASGEMVP